MPVDLPPRSSRLLDRAYRRKLTLIAGAIIGLILTFGIGLFVDYGAMVG